MRKWYRRAATHMHVCEVKKRHGSPLKYFFFFLFCEWHHYTEWCKRRLTRLVCRKHHPVRITLHGLSAVKHHPVCIPLHGLSAVKHHPVCIPLHGLSAVKHHPVCITLHGLSAVKHHSISLSRHSIQSGNR